MSSAVQDGKFDDPKDEVVVLRQRSKRSWLTRNSNWITGSFDLVSIGLVLAVLFAGIRFRLDYLGLIALVSATFALLSIRESKRDRETSVEPTLFIAKRRDEDYGITNLGNGPAHELRVKISGSSGGDWKSESWEIEDEILQTSGFLRLGTEEQPAEVKMEYRTNLGYKEHEVIRYLTEDTLD